MATEWKSGLFATGILFLIGTIVALGAQRKLHRGDDIALQTDSADSASVADDSAEGKKRLKEIEQRAKQLTQDRDRVNRERRPIVVRRDSMVGEVVQARQRVLQSQAAAAATERQIARLENQIQFSAGSETKELRSQQSRLRTSLNSLLKKISSDRKLIDDRATQIRALHPQIVSLDQRMQRLDDELAESRKQWLGIRQPLEKYSRGDFEGLRRVLDDWLILDGDWPEAYAWAALCAYELDAIDSAADYLEKARRLSVDPARSNKASPQLEALTALIRRRQPGQSAKAETALANALRLADKNSDWETYFLLGRCYFERPDDAVRAKTHFERALAIRPTADCAKLWLARLQTTSAVPAVRNVYEGTTSLEQLWEKHGRSSWRLASFLAEAYSASQRMTDAEAMWKTASKLAPANQNVRLVRGNKND